MSKWYEEGRRSDHYHGLPPSKDRLIEEAYRRGFQQAIRALDEVADVDLKVAERIAFAMRFDLKPHRDYMHEFLYRLRGDGR